MAANVGIRFQGDDYVSPVTKNIKGSIDGLATSAKSSILTGFGVGAGVAAFGLVKNAIGAVIGPLGDAWQLSKDTQVAQVLLGQALKNNIPNWTGNASGAEKFSLAQGKLGFESNDVREALGHLVGVTHDLAEAQQLVGLAEDLARSKGIDLARATDIVTKAHEGNGKALKGMGIDIKGATTATQLLDAVTKNVTTTAEKFAETSSGKASIAQVKLTEAMTKLGNVIDKIAQTVIPIAATALGFLVDNLNVLAPGLIAVAVAVTALVIPALVAMGLAAWAALGPLGPIILALAVLGTAVAGVSSAFDSNTQSLREAEPHWRHFGTTIVESASDTITATGAAYQSGFTLIRNAAQHGIVDPLWQAAQEAKVKAQGEAAKIPKAMGDAMLAAEKDLTDSVKILTDALAQALTPAQSRAAAIAFLTSDAYAQALASGKPAAIAKAQELANAAGSVLHASVASGAAAGLDVGYAYVNGLNAALAKGLTGQTYTYIQKYTKLLKMAGSPDYTHAIEAGVGVAKHWLGGVNQTLGMGKLNLPSLSGSGGVSGMSGSGSGGGGGTVININIPRDSFIDGASVDRLASVIATRLRFAPGS